MPACECGASAVTVDENNELVCAAHANELIGV